MIEVRAEVGPTGPYRLPRPSADGLLRSRDGVVFRYVRSGGHDVLLRAAQLRDGRVVLGARAGTTVPSAPPAGSGPAAAESDADPRRAAEAALERWRFGLGVDLDLAPFVAAHKDDPLIGPSIRTRPWLRPGRRLSVFEALLCAVCEQLIAYEDAVRIERRLIARHGSVRTPDVATHPRLREVPDAATVAHGLVPAHMEACGLAPKRAIALHRAAREIASGRIVTEAGCDPDRVLLRLGRLPEIGTWTLALVASQALGRHDRPPSGDLNLRKALGRILTGDPRARVPEQEVDAWLARYAPWGALAAVHVMATRPEVLAGRGASTVPVAGATRPTRHPALAGSPAVAQQPVIPPPAAPRPAPVPAPRSVPAGTPAPHPVAA